MNRNLICKDCGETKWLSQKQWRKRVDTEGSNIKVKRRFRCKKCLILKRDDIFKYQLMYGKPIKELKSKLKLAYRVAKKTNNFEGLQGCIYDFLREIHIDPSKCVYHTEGSKLFGITIQDYPFVGDLYIPLYVRRKSSY